MYVFLQQNIFPQVSDIVLHAINCSMGRITHFKEIHLVDSKLDVLFYLPHLRNVTAKNSTINTMAELLMTTENDAKNQVCVNVAHSTILAFISLDITCEANYYHSFINTIRNSTIDVFEVYMSSIQDIVHNGLTVRDLHLCDVHMTHLHRDSIHISANGSLFLNNVTIDRCDDPCFNISNGVSYFLNNVSINKEFRIKKTHTSSIKK